MTTGSSSSLRRLGAVLAALSLVLPACRIAVELEVEVAEDGTGTVVVTAVLDADAAAAIGGAEGLALDDLAASGWDLEDPATDPGGGVTLFASRAFTDGGELEALLDQIAGEGIFTDVEVDRVDGFGRTERTAGYTVTLSGDPTQFGDDELTEVLGGLPLGRTPEELAAAGATEPGAATLTVGVVVEGGEPDGATLDATAGEPQQASVSSTATEQEALPFVLAGSAAAMLLLAAVFFAVALLRRR